MLRISQLKLPVEHTEAQLKKKLLKTAHIKEQDLKQFFIRKRSVDGRKKPELYYVYTVDLIVANEEHVKKNFQREITNCSGKKLSYSRTRRQKAPEKTCCYRKWTGGPVLRVFTCL